jgi:hypothetical protein
MITSGAVLRTTALLASLLTVGGDASANPAAFVPSAAGLDEPSLFHVTVDYAYTIDSARIEREAIGTGADPLGSIPRLDDLSFKQFRHTLTPKLELGVLRDAWISFAVPLVIAQARELSLDGISRDASSTIRDGLLTADGFDARDPATPLPPGADLLFRGENRAGVEQLRFGLGVALMNQQRDSTKPTWKLGADLHIAVGKVMRFDALKADEETGVSKGVHELKLWTSFDRRYDRLEGYFEMFWLVPLTARAESLFDDIDQRPGTFGATNTLPGQKAGVTFGLETYAIDDRVNKNSVSLDVSARVVGHFEGRDYSEMWEVFALAGDVRRDGPLVIDRDPSMPGVQAVSHPGISNIENHLETAARFGIRGQLGGRMHFGVLVDVAWKTDHAITFADAGIDLPTCSGEPGQVEGRDCELDNNDLVNPGTGEVNPLHVPRIDLVGHRYLSVDNFVFSIGVQAQVQF